MATEPRHTSDPDDAISNIAGNFEQLAAILQQSMEQREALGQEDDLSHLRKAHAAAVRGSELANRIVTGTD